MSFKVRFLYSPNPSISRGNPYGCVYPYIHIVCVVIGKLYIDYIFTGALRKHVFSPQTRFVTYIYIYIHIYIHIYACGVGEPSSISTTPHIVPRVALFVWILTNIITIMYFMKSFYYIYYLFDYFMFIIIMCCF